MFAFRLKAGVGRAAHIHVAQPLLLQSERLVQRQQQQLKQLLQLRSSHQASFNRFTGVVAHRTSTTNVDVVRRLMCGHQFGHGPDSPGEERAARSLPPSKFHDVYNFKSVNPNHYLHWVEATLEESRSAQSLNETVVDKDLAIRKKWVKNGTNRYLQVTLETTDVSTATGRAALSDTLKRYEAFLEEQGIHWQDDKGIINLMIRAHVGVRNFDVTMNLLEMMIKSGKKVAGRHFHPIIQGLLESIKEENDAEVRAQNLQFAVWLHDDCMRRSFPETVTDAETENLFFEVAKTCGGEVADNHAFAILRHRSSKWSEIPAACAKPLLDWMGHVSSPSAPSSEPQFKVTTNATIDNNGYCATCCHTLEPPELALENHATLLAEIRKVLLPAQSNKALKQEIVKFDEWLDENADASVVIDGHNIMHNPIYSEGGFTHNSRAGFIRANKERRWQTVTTEANCVNKLNASRVCVGNVHQEVTQAVLEDFFSEGGKISNVKAILQLAPESHTGQGEVHFRFQEDARRAVEIINGSMLFASKITVVESGTTPKGFSKLRVSNIHSDVTWYQVREHFTTKVTAPHFVRLYDVHHAGTDVKLLHSGRGEVQFESKEDAEKAVQTLNGSKMYGNELHVRMDVRWKENAKMKWMGDRYQTTVDHYQSRGVKAVGVCKAHIFRDTRNMFLEQYERDGSLYVIPDRLFNSSNAGIDDLFILYAALKLGEKKPGVNIVACDQYRDHLEITRVMSPNSTPETPGTLPTNLTADFERWLFGHSCPVEISVGGYESFPYQSAKLTELKPLPAFNSIVQEQSNGSWHIPVGDSSSQSRYENSRNPSRWHCIQATGHEQ